MERIGLKYRVFDETNLWLRCFQPPSFYVYAKMVKIVFTYEYGRRNLRRSVFLNLIRIKDIR